MKLLWLRDSRNVLTLALCLILLWLSFALSQPGDTFKASVYWGQFASIAGEQQWAYAFAITGMMGLWGMTTCHPIIRQSAIAILATMHGVIALCFVLGTPPGVPMATSVGPYTIYALLGYYVVWRRFVP